MALSLSDATNPQNEQSQGPSGDESLPSRQKYSRQYLEPLSKSALIDLIMKLQEENYYKKSNEVSKEQEAPTPKPKMPSNLLQSLALAKNKRKQKDLVTTVRTRDGKVYTETIGADGTISRTLQSQEAMPQYEAEDSPNVMALSSFIYRADEEKWVAVQHAADATNSDGTNGADGDEKEHDDGPKALTILSFNVWFADQQWKERRTKMLSMLKEINPDVFCLQEVTHRFLFGLCDDEYIRSHFELSDEKNNLKMSTVSPYGVLIGCNRRKNGLSMEALNICRLTSNMGRKLLSSRIRLSGRQSMWINTVHLESLNNAAVRSNQLKDIFNAFTKDQGDAMVMGDFNFGDKNDGESDHIPLQFVDCWKEHSERAMSASSETEAPSGVTCGGQRLDRILLRSAKWKVEHFEIIGKVNMPSDHLGVVTRIQAK